MAHNIHYNEEKGTHSFFSVKEKAWHGLGTIVQDYPNSKEALEFAGLDFQVEKRPVFTMVGKDSLEQESDIPSIPVLDYFATVRTDNDAVLGLVGRDYKVVQNTDAFSFFDAIVGGDGIMYETAGALGKGERIFITAKLPSYIQVGKDDLLEKYLFLTTSHDGSGSITAAFTPIRIVCNNTLNAALRNCTNSIKIRHTGSAVDKLKEAHKVMGIANKLSEELEGIFNQWSRVRITDKEVKLLVQQAMAPNKEVLANIIQGKEDNLSTLFSNICDDVLEYSESNPSQQLPTTKGTVFGAYNAVTGYFQNVRNYKDDEAKLKSVMFGTAQLRTQQAFNLCSDFVKGGVAAFRLN